MLSELFDWWARQMLDLVPARLRQSDAGLADGWRVMVESLDEPHRITLARRSRGRTGTARRFVLDASGQQAARTSVASAGGAVVLELPPQALLERDTVLPLAAEGRLDRVLGYEMDRITPFSADELFWSWTLKRRERAQGDNPGRLHLRLSMVPRAGLADILRNLAAIGLAPSLLVVPGADGLPRPIPLSRSANRGRKVGLGRIAAIACALLAVAVIATPFVQDLRAIAAADRRIDTLKPRIAQVDALRLRIAASTGGADVFASELARLGNPLQALAALTDILPDDTFLSQLSLRQRSLTFSGQSARAARLIAALAADPVLRNPTFVTPVTRANSSGSDLFSIRAELGL